MTSATSLACAIAATVAVTASAALDARAALALSAFAFALAIAVSAIFENAPLWRPSSHLAQPAPATALARTTRLTALTYAWCGITLLAVYLGTPYLGTPVHWQHGWQYGSALLLIGAANLAYLKRLEASNIETGLASSEQVGFVVGLAALHGLAIAALLAWLIGSGKLDTKKGDWAANDIFLAGGVALIVLSAVVVKTHLSLTTARASVRAPS